ncbi:uncharacterized protein LOC115562276 [Drosophila navojoa]|uniref:uncharacterized protein LOC115562276 n=1 Tax=Drosophila navojoa TaxID=7232 RepID=UPI0011BF1A73|nr:uncharacterized protein LOC115562276 [Drosophila navojoa]
MSDPDTQPDPEPLVCSRHEQQHQQLLRQHNELKLEHSSLKRQLNTVKLHLSTLSIENEYLEQQIEKQAQQNHRHECFNRNIKQELINSTNLAINAQTRVTFPHKFLVQIFAPFAEDKALVEHCVHIDEEMAKSMHTIRMHAYQEHELKLRDVISKKQADLRSKLVAKYELKLDKCELSRKCKSSLIRQRCFDLFKHFMHEHCADKEYTSAYLADLKAVYEQTTQHF